jgi:pimeloyl-ACP methyl ester carboxylesterase
MGTPHTDQESALEFPIPGAAQRFANVFGIRLAYLQAGAGLPVVLLHGLASSSLTWAASIEALAQEHTVYALDLPGHGDSDRPVMDGGITSGVKVFGRFLERLGLHRVALVGNSMGGLVALRFALDYPDRVTHLVLVDSAGLGQEVSLALRAASVPGLGELLLNGAFLSVKGFGKRYFKYPERIAPKLLRALHRARTVQLSSRVMLTMARAGAGLTGIKGDSYLLPRLGEVRAPVLVVWGEHDRVMPAEHAREVARRYSHIQVRVFTEAGHWPHMESPDEFNGLVLRFLKDDAAVRD